MAKTAGIVVIGNEILSGKVVDANSPYLCQELRPLGVDVRRIVVLPDDVEVIAEHVAALASPAFDYVLTTGGVGPTHDDVTIEAVARGLGPPSGHPARVCSALLQEHWAERPAAVRDKMASVPEGSAVADGAQPAHPGSCWLATCTSFRASRSCSGGCSTTSRSASASRRITPRHVYVRARESTFAHHLEAVMADVSRPDAGLLSRG